MISESLEIGASFLSAAADDGTRTEPELQLPIELDDFGWTGIQGSTILHVGSVAIA